MFPSPVKPLALDYAPKNSGKRTIGSVIRPLIRPLAFLSAGSALGACLGLFLSPPPIYTDTGYLRVNITRVRPLDPEIARALQEKFDADIKRAVEILNLPQVADLALQKREPTPRSGVRSPADLRRHLKIEQPSRTELIVLQIEDYDAEQAARLLNEYTSVAFEKMRNEGLDNISVLTGSNTPLQHPRDSRPSFALYGALAGALVAVLILLRRTSRRKIPKP